MISDLQTAVEVLSRAGAVVLLPDTRRAFSVESVATLIDLKVGWVKCHLDEFPNWWRLPGGGQNGGEIRIPSKDVDAFMERRKRARLTT